MCGADDDANLNHKAMCPICQLSQLTRTPCGETWRLHRCTVSLSQGFHPESMINQRLFSASADTVYWPVMVSFSLYCFDIPNQNSTVQSNFLLIYLFCLICISVDMGIF